MKIKKIAYPLTIIILIGIFSCTTDTQISGKFIEIKFDNKMHTRIINKYFDGTQQKSAFQPSEFIIINGKKVQDFSVTDTKSLQVADKIGNGIEVSVIGNFKAADLDIQKTAQFRYYDDFPDIIFTDVKYTNNGVNPLDITGWVNNNYTLQADNAETEPVFWSYQSGSYESRPDWVLPLQEGFKQQNFMGMNASDYGGGTPVVDVWTKKGGISVGHIEMVPKLVSLPVSRDSVTGDARLFVQYLKDQQLKTGESISTFTTFVGVHKGDYFHSLAEYSDFMQKQGIQFQPFPESAYEPIWCAWGYQRNFNVNEVLGTLPKVKELGFKWAVLDDGWQTAEGDWYLNPAKFPRGDADMIAFVKKIHQQGLKAKLWWAPLAVDPGTDLLENHPDLLLLNQDGSKRDISWWDSFYICPAYEGTIDYTKKLVQKIIGEWDYDGLKIDGQHLNGVPPCYNSAHHHEYPEQSVEGIPSFFKMIYETAQEIKPDAVVEICPCGTAYAFHTMPFMNQPVSSDPESSWQIRLKGKTLKALMGADAPYYGDHVELSDNGDDFASAVGVGAVVGSKFTWPNDRSKRKRALLTKEKEVLWKKWVAIYEKYQLSKGQYLGELYDIGFDKPETHAIQKDGTMYYAFYAPEYKGTVEFRGLENLGKTFRVMNIINDKELGTIQNTNPKMDVDFKNYLIVQVKAE